MDEAHDVRVSDDPVDRIFDQAASASNIQLPEVPLEVGSLGSGTGALLAAQMLANAGIIVELVGGDVEKEDDLFEFVQIVDEDVLECHLGKFDEIAEVCLVPTHHMLGFQIKLDGRRKWKVKCSDEMKDHHNPTSRSSRSVAGDSFREFTNHNLHEIFVPHNGDMRATIAVSNVITITVIFKTVRSGDHIGECAWDEDASHHLSPPVYQRRIDMLFHNKYCARLQVRSAFCVPCSVFQI